MKPEIYETTRRFGTILENVAIDPNTRHIDLDSEVYTETRVQLSAVAHPERLRRRRWAVTPRLSSCSPPTRSVYFLHCPTHPGTGDDHFISGYKAKVAGTERGVTEPQASSVLARRAIHGAPAAVYAEILAKKIREHGSKTYLINTGWTVGRTVWGSA